MSWPTIKKSGRYHFLRKANVSYLKMGKWKRTVIAQKILIHFCRLKHFSYQAKYDQISLGNFKNCAFLHWIQRKTTLFEKYSQLSDTTKIGRSVLRVKIIFVKLNEVFMMTLVQKNIKKAQKRIVNNFSKNFRKVIVYWAHS